MVKQLTIYLRKREMEEKQEKFSIIVFMCKRPYQQTQPIYHVRSVRQCTGIIWYANCSTLLG